MDKRVNKTRFVTIETVADLLNLDMLEAYRQLALCNAYKNDWYATKKANYNTDWFCLQTANDFFDFTYPGLKDAFDLLSDKKVKPERIIDVGAGIGLSTDMINDKFPKAEVFYNNMQGKQSLIAKILFGKKLKFLICDVFKISEKADVVFAFEFFEHFKDPLDVFSKVAKITECKYIVMQNSFGAFGYGHMPEFVSEGEKIEPKHYKAYFKHEIENMGWKVWQKGRVLLAKSP